MFAWTKSSILKIHVQLDFLKRLNYSSSIYEDLSCDVKKEKANSLYWWDF